MSDPGERPELRICVIGAFRVLTHDGQDLTPRGRKARALLAILALTPTRRRSRPALQDKLWSDRGSEQGAASLRQTLTEIRSALGERYRDCLVSDMRGIGLDTDRVTVDLDTADLSEFAATVEPPELLEDIEVADEEFEHWLRNQRAGFEQRIAASKPSVAAPPGEASAVVRTDPAPTRPWIRILAPLPLPAKAGCFFPAWSETVSLRGWSISGASRCATTGRVPRASGFAWMRCRLSREVAVNVALLSADGALQLWSGSGSDLARKRLRLRRAAIAGADQSVGRCRRPIPQPDRFVARQLARLRPGVRGGAAHIQD